MSLLLAWTVTEMAIFCTLLKFEANMPLQPEGTPAETQ
jgi:hypothetical protein